MQAVLHYAGHGSKGDKRMIQNEVGRELAVNKLRPECAGAG